jgi:molecular chaperone DnaK (HSP70)
MVLYVKQKKENSVLIASALRLLLDQELRYKENKTDKEKANEDFLKFVSDSRDWAYQYIEDVQAGLKEFVNEVGPQVEYYENYGRAVDGMLAPHDFALKKISSEFKKLKNLLPEDYDRIVE